MKMRMMGTVAILAVASAGCLILGVQGAGHAQGVASGATMFQQHCAMCHSLSVNGIGPSLGGVMGRKAAGAAGYSYSAALTKSGWKWSPARLDAFLAAPQSAVPGTKMPVSTPDAAQRKAIIGFLAAGR